ncbi:MAG: ATP synthase F1 subunit epsilon [Actinobacteria bacterium]|nr:ATP synthase F1 subunit epsilon [Actinomycetota bacterium]
MATPFSVTITTPAEEMWTGEAELVIARSPEGEFGIMNGHVPFLASLVPGRVTVVSGSERQSFAVPGGFLEASGSLEEYHVYLLADDAEEIGEHIDVSEARRRAQELEERRIAEEDVDQEAEARLRAAMAGTQLGRG